MASKLVVRKAKGSRLGGVIGTKTYTNRKGQRRVSKNYSPRKRAKAYCVDLVCNGVVSAKTGEVVSTLTPEQRAYREGYVQAQSDSAALYKFKKTGKIRKIHRA